MEFSNDIFISYAHLDNQAPSASVQGWVSQFEHALTLRLGEVWGHAPRIWRDPKLQGNDVFADVLDERYRNAAVLVSVVTPRYVQSDWCQRELTGFWEVSGQTGGPVVGHKARVFKVLKTPVDGARLPQPVQPLLGYEFYKPQAGSGRPLEFNKLYGPEAEREFWLRMNDLAYDLAETLTQLTAPAGGDYLSEDRGGRLAAYLAATTSDLVQQRDSMRRELLRQGWRVLPEVELPLIAADCERVVRGQLAQCAVSIHLVGAIYGLVPEGGAESMPALQARLADELATGQAVRTYAAGRPGGQAATPHARLVWIAPGSVPADERQKDLIETLRDDPQPSAGSDLLETPLDELVRLAVARLDAAEAAAKAVAKAAAKAESLANAVPGAGAAEETSTPPRQRIYLICSAGDFDAVLPMRDDLFDQGFEVVRPVFEGDEGELRNLHENELRDCDGLLIYYGQGSALWLQQQLAAQRRLPALRRNIPLRASAICIAPPSTQAKQLLRTHEARMLRMPEGYTVAALRPFVDALLAAAPAPGAQP